MTKAGDDMEKALADLGSLAHDLGCEPWHDYDSNLTKACMLLVRNSMRELAKVKKAISKITPAESRGEGEPVEGDPWYGRVLDEMK